MVVGTIVKKRGLEGLGGQEAAIGSSTPGSASKSAKRDSAGTPRASLGPSRVLQYYQGCSSRLLHARIGILWVTDSIYYKATVIDYNPKTQKHRVRYDDGHKEWLSLRKEDFRWLLPRATSAGSDASLQAELLLEGASNLPQGPIGGPPAFPAKGPAPVGADAIGRKLTLYCRVNGELYCAEVLAWDAARQRHHLLYDDAEDEWVDLAAEVVCWPKAGKQSMGAQHVGLRECAGVYSLALEPECDAGGCRGQSVPKRRKAVGWRIAVYRAQEMRFVESTVVQYEGAVGLHRVCWTDGKSEMLDMQAERVKWIFPPDLAAQGLHHSQNSEKDEHHTHERRTAGSLTGIPVISATPTPASGVGHATLLPDTQPMCSSRRVDQQPLGSQMAVETGKEAIWRGSSNFAAIGFDLAAGLTAQSGLGDVRLLTPERCAERVTDAVQTALGQPKQVPEQMSLQWQQMPESAAMQQMPESAAMQQKGPQKGHRLGAETVRECKVLDTERGAQGQAASWGPPEGPIKGPGTSAFQDSPLSKALASVIAQISRKAAPVGQFCAATGHPYSAAGHPGNAAVSMLQSRGEGQQCHDASLQFHDAPLQGLGAPPTGQACDKGLQKPVVDNLDHCVDLPLSVHEMHPSAAVVQIDSSEPTGTPCATAVQPAQECQLASVRRSAVDAAAAVKLHAAAAANGTVSRDLLLSPSQVTAASTANGSNNKHQLIPPRKSATVAAGAEQPQQPVNSGRRAAAGACPLPSSAAAVAVGSAGASGGFRAIRQLRRLHPVWAERCEGHVQLPVTVIIADGMTGNTPHLAHAQKQIIGVVVRDKNDMVQQCNGSEFGCTTSCRGQQPPVDGGHQSQPHVDGGSKVVVRGLALNENSEHNRQPILLTKGKEGTSGVDKCSAARGGTQGSKLRDRVTLLDSLLARVGIAERALPNDSQMRGLLPTRKQREASPAYHHETPLIQPGSPSSISATSLNILNSPPPKKNGGVYGSTRIGDGMPLSPAPLWVQPQPYRAPAGPWGPDVRSLACGGCLGPDAPSDACGPLTTTAEQTACRHLLGSPNHEVDPLLTLQQQVMEMAAEDVDALLESINNDTSEAESVGVDMTQGITTRIGALPLQTPSCKASLAASGEASLGEATLCETAAQLGRAFCKLTQPCGTEQTVEAAPATGEEAREPYHAVGACDTVGNAEIAAQTVEAVVKHIRCALAGGQQAAGRCGGQAQAPHGRLSMLGTDAVLPLANVVTGPDCANSPHSILAKSLPGIEDTATAAGTALPLTRSTVSAPALCCAAAAVQPVCSGMVGVERSGRSRTLAPKGQPGQHRPSWLEAPPETIHAVGAAGLSAVLRRPLVAKRLLASSGTAGRSLGNSATMGRSLGSPGAAGRSICSPGGRTEPQGRPIGSPGSGAGAPPVRCAAGQQGDSGSGMTTHSDGQLLPVSAA